MNDRLSLSFGALSPPIKKQLAAQGLTLDKKKCELFQRKADAIVLLSVNSILAESEKDRALQRLIKKIAKEVVRKKPSHLRVVKDSIA